MKDEKPNDLGELLENTMAAGVEQIKEDEYVSLEDSAEFRLLDGYFETSILVDLRQELTTALNTLEEEDFDRDVVARWLMIQIEKHLTGA